MSFSLQQGCQTSLEKKAKPGKKRQIVNYHILIIIFHCGLMVHITDTRSQKVVSYTSAQLQKRCLHMTNIERGKALYPHHSCIVIRKSTENGYPYSSASHKLVRVQPWEEQNTSPALLTFLCLVCTQCTHIFTTQKQCWWDANTETIHGQLLHLVSIQERWIIKEKWRFVKSIRH